MIDIFDKIRRLQYNTVQEYNSDINTLRNKVVEKVNYYFDSKLHQNSDSDSGSDCDVSMNSGSDSSNEKVVKSGRSEQKNMGNSTRTNGAKLLNKSVKEQSTNELPQRDRDETLKLILSAFETIADASYTVLVKKRLILEEIEVVGVTRKSVSGEDINGESSVGASSSDEEIFQEIISFDSQELMKRLWRRECDEKVVCLVEAPTYTPFSDVTIDQVNGKINNMHLYYVECDFYNRYLYYC